jgi:hypothetical protein
MTTGTEMLGQQELLEPPQRRRLQVAPGHTAILGVDPSTLRLATTIIEPDGSRLVSTVSFPGTEGPQRLSDIYEATREWARNEQIGRQAAGRPLIGFALIEQPSGENVNLPLYYAHGVIQAALYDGLYMPGAPVRIESIPPQSWKKTACGRGNIYKPTRKKLGRTPVFEDYDVAVWARLNGYAGSSWDEADAWGIAEAARREVALVER